MRRILSPSRFQELKWMIASRRLTQGDAAWAKNAKYDAETYEIMRRVLTAGATAIDIGASRGKFVYEFDRYAPGGRHFAFEPIPDSFEVLNRHCSGTGVECHNLALSDRRGTTAFHVSENLGYSGFRPTDDAKSFGPGRDITVRTEKLDDLIPDDLDVSFIKIDVEGAEFMVLRGAENIIKRCAPTIVFEFEGHAAAYGTTAGDVFDLLQSFGLDIWNTEYFLADKPAYSRDEFVSAHEKAYEFYFVSAPAGATSDRCP